MTRLHELALLRLAAQRLVGPGMGSATEAVGWMTASQAQQFGGALTSVALRTAAGTRKDVEAALDAGDAVRSWPFRGTLHLVAAVDLGWMLQLGGPRVVAGMAARRAQLDLDAATLVEAERLAVGALAGGQRLRRAELFAVWDEGLGTAGQRGAHMLAYLALQGVVCYGPLRDGEQAVVLVDEWVSSPRRLAREEAVGELALRYFRSHGPATAKDLARWANLVVADVRAGIGLARAQLAAVEVDGVEYLMDPETPERLEACRREARGVLLLPGFDEFILGYGDRGAMVPAEFAERIVPGGNGMFKPTVVSNGRVVGTWKHAGRGAARSIDATPFTSFTAKVAKAIPRVHATLP